MRITEAKFAGSSVRAADKPGRRLPEFAFIGRSNVGKSSLINMLCGNSRLAKTSSTPGKTKLINHFIINDSWYLVDLPGYGFAKISKKEREDLRIMINDYIQNSQEMVLLFVLIDSRHDIQKIDLEFIAGLGENEIPFALILTNWGLTRWPHRSKGTRRSCWSNGRNFLRCSSRAQRLRWGKKRYSISYNNTYNRLIPCTSNTEWNCSHAEPRETSHARLSKA